MHAGNNAVSVMTIIAEEKQKKVTWSELTAHTQLQCQQ
jgi:hypothetical protein